MSGWRAFGSVIIIHGRVFEQEIRELQLDIEHVRQLLEAAERGRAVLASRVARHQIQRSRTRAVEGNRR
ncbi:unnamed protein product [Cylicocyclus nassatus]|uniref:Uncharacterized protein n=1 Tax=Cylicocyclus nassatus TaxID=53992 RepID=A0AA36H6Y0_CYLNA|nr:unnamed protein product [Cylicocyclus nassatus]